MTAWPFLLYAAAVVCWCGLHLLAALRALKRSRAEPTAEIDMEYVRVRDYHARAVREGRSPSVPVQAIVTALPEMPGALLSRSDCVVQQMARVTAIVSMGTLTLRKRVSVSAFADSRGEMIIGDECTIGGPATSAAAIRLGHGVSARSVFAPIIMTGGWAPLKLAHAADAEPVLIPPPAAELSVNPQFRGALRQISEDTWLYDGDLRVQAPLSVACKLIVLGSLGVPSGSILADDIKTKGDLIVGEDCICRGSLVSGRDIELGSGTRFERSIYAAGELRLKSAVHGEGSGEVAVFARLRVLLGENILIRGRIASEGLVISA